MPRIPTPFAAGDMSAFAKSLRKQLAAREALPSHVELLNMLARSAGYRNYQHVRANVAEGPRPGFAGDAAEVEPVDLRRVERVARHFDDGGRLLRWPARLSHQQLCLWGLQAFFPSGRSLGEAQVTVVLNERHVFGDHALLRRALCEGLLLRRTPDGRDYRRIERRPPGEAAALIGRLGRARTGAAA